ncbi:MAG: hypothetical protein WCG27_06050, partial [Pseudomonadota bacterium]
MKDFNFLQSSFDSVPRPDNKTMTTPELPHVILVEDDQLLGNTIKKFLEKKIGLTIHHYLSPMD